MSDPAHAPAPFGVVLGMAPGGVPVYSSDYDTVDPKNMPDRSAFSHRVDGEYMGYKWQCVELARRWLYVTRGYVFDDIAMAYDIFRLTSVKMVAEGRELPLKSFRNGAKRRPEVGCLMIWNEGGEFQVTGHVAIVTEVTDHYVRIVEQNVGHRVWPEGQTWSRELPARTGREGGYWVRCTFSDASILGWVIQTDDATHAEMIENTDPKLFALKPRQAQSSPVPFLNPENPSDAAFIEMMSGHRLTSREEDEGLYFVMSEAAAIELKRATNELHAMFLHATGQVLHDDALLAKFGFPTALIPRIRQSWENRRTHAITGRFDFGMTPQGLKVYEYNVDSGSCHMEAGRVQGAWADAHGVTEGRDPGSLLTQALIETWRKSQIDGIIHLFRDEHLEEVYHTRYMRDAIEAAGLECRIVNGVEGLAWAQDGRVVDVKGTRIDWVWKTWAWETALDQLKAECETDSETGLEVTTAPRSYAPRLVDVLLHPDVMVFEPLWTLVPSNKAILPVLWDMMPGHPYLLETEFELTASLRSKGYVVKPIVGRCGRNITLVDTDKTVLAETSGQFHDRDQIYQAMFRLPEIAGLSVQVCSFTADGHYAGACLRCDPSPVIKSESDVLPFRIVSNKAF